MGADWRENMLFSAMQNIGVIETLKILIPLLVYIIVGAWLIITEN